MDKLLVCKVKSKVIYTATKLTFLFYYAVMIYGEKVRKITIYHNTDYVNKGQSSLFKRKKTCRLNVVNFDTLN